MKKIYLDVCSLCQPFDDQNYIRIDELLTYNFGIADASHIAFSESYNSTFISCDDKLLNKCQKYVNMIRCLNPLTFCEMENLK